jgi:hypothetical protein
MANSRLEEYVQAATARLPESDRALEQMEMRQHLSALIAAHEELGDTTETATDAAVKQLGDARVLRQELLKTHRRARLHGLTSAPLSEFWTINWVPAVFGAVVGGGILGALYARERFPLRRSSLILACVVQTAVVAGFGWMLWQNWLHIGIMCALYWGLMTSCALLGFQLASVSTSERLQSPRTARGNWNIGKSLVALGSIALTVGSAAGVWQIQSQRGERTRQFTEARRVAEAQYNFELQKMRREADERRKPHRTP